MANMGYCRFENTANDLADCYEADGLHDPEVLSESEQRARKRLIDLCRQIVNEVYDGDDDA